MDDGKVQVYFVGVVASERAQVSGLTLVTLLLVVVLTLGVAVETEKSAVQTKRPPLRRGSHHNGSSVCLML